jgi:hypothetical protein
MKALVAYDSLFGNTELIARAVAADLAGVAVAAFDTRYRMPRLLSGAASVIIVNQLRAGGAVLLTEPASFFVRGREGPLEAGEVERAQAWGATIRQLYERRFS